MAKLHHLCDECGSEFTILFSEEDCEDNPQFCCFCGEYLIETEDIEDEE